MTPDTEPRRPIRFSIDGQLYSTEEPRQKAAALLEMAGLDPAVFDLGEIQSRTSQPKWFADNDEVTIEEGARFVSIREKADVA